jgi:hypothetical protein
MANIFETRIREALPDDLPRLLELRFLGEGGKRRVYLATRSACSTPAA